MGVVGTELVRLGVLRPWEFARLPYKMMIIGKDKHFRDYVDNDRTVFYELPASFPRRAVPLQGSPRKVIVPRTRNANAPRVARLRADFAQDADADLVTTTAPVADAPMADFGNDSSVRARAD